MSDHFPSHFAHVFSQFIAQANVSYGQLAQTSGIPKRTIANWATGKVKQPRHRDDVIKLASALSLNKVDASQLLSAAKFPIIPLLVEQAEAHQDNDLLEALTPWREITPEAPVPFQAVAQLPYFVGRQEIVSTIETAVVQQTASLFVLHGMGGVGKTALATQLAYLLREHFPDGVLWARVDTTDTMSILNAFAAAFGVDVSYYTDINSRSGVVRDLLSRKQALVVLDNAERSSQLRPLLPPTTGTCTVLVTTRQANLSVLLGAHLFALTSFAADAVESLALFRHLLGDSRTAREGPILRQIAELLGHLPLALAIAAGQLVQSASRPFLEKLRSQRARLTTLVYDDFDVRLSFNVSYEALPPDLQRFFNPLGVFAGDDFNDEAAAYITNITLSQAQANLHTLRQLALVQDGRNDRFRLHPLLRDYANEQLTDTTISQRMVLLYTEFAQAHKRDYEALALEHSNILAALAEAQKQQDETTLLQGVGAAFSFWLDRGLHPVAEHYLPIAEQMARTRSDWQALARIMHNRGVLAQAKGEYALSETLLQEGLQFAQRAEGGQEMMAIHINLGVLFSRRCLYVQAENHYLAGLELAREMDDQRGISYLLLNVGVMSERQGHYDTAVTYLQEALLITEEQSLDRIRGVILDNLGVIATEQRAYEKAMTHLQAALHHTRTIERQEQESIVLADLGMLALRQEQITTAQEQLQQALKLAKEIGHPQATLYALVRMGEIWLQANNIPKAQTTFIEAEQLAQKIDTQEYIGLAAFGLARVAWHEGNTAVAQQQLTTSLQQLSPIQHKRVAEVKAWGQTMIA